MHTADLLELAVEAVKALGFRPRWEWLGGNGGGGCEIRGEKFAFIDLAQDPKEQLSTLLELLARETAARPGELPAALASLVTHHARHAA